MYCKHCMKMIPDGTQYCPNCGKSQSIPVNAKKKWTAFFLCLFWVALALIVSMLERLEQAFCGCLPLAFLALVALWI